MIFFFILRFKNLSNISPFKVITVILVFSFSFSSFLLFCFRINELKTNITTNNGQIESRVIYLIETDYQNTGLVYFSFLFGILLNNICFLVLAAVNCLLYFEFRKIFRNKIKLRHK